MRLSATLSSERRGDPAVLAGERSVLLLTDSETFAGTERHIMDLAAALTELGVDVIIGAPSASAVNVRASEIGVRTVNIEKRGTVDLAAVLKIILLLRSGEIDIVHAHNGRTAMLASIAVRLAGRGTCIASEHFIKPARTARRGLTARASQIAHRLAAGGIARTVAVSEAVRRAVIGRGELRSNRISVVPNGIEPPDPVSLVSASRIREEFDITIDAPLVICAARLEPEKDVESLIKAMRLVILALPTAMCVIAGDGILRGHLQKLIEASGLSKSVRLAGFRADVLSLMHAGNLFVLPSLEEPFGLVLLEAMALGLPVVTTDAGGPSEIVIDGVSGLLVPPASPAALAGGIIEVLKTPERGREMGTRGRDRYIDRFTARQMAISTLAVYTQAMEVQGS